MNPILFILSLTFLILPFVGLYVTFVHRRWVKLHGPSPLLRHLLIASIALDVASFTVMIVAALLITGNPLPSPYGSILISFSLYIALGVKIYRRIDLRALDRPDPVPEVLDGVTFHESQNQREDREFGEKRRRLEVKHTDETETKK